jgi:hypothetical protein
MKKTLNNTISIYYFRLLSDQDEEFFRDIEILSDQTFLDFHTVIQQSIEFDGNELASFYQCNRDWEKVHEITLIDMEEDELPLTVMSKARLFEFVDGLKQRFLYEYNFLSPTTLYIELMQVKKPEKGKKYPRCVNCSGGLNMTLGVDDPLEESIFKDFKDFDDIIDEEEDIAEEPEEEPEEEENFQEEED